MFTLLKDGKFVDSVCELMQSARTTLCAQTFQSFIECGLIVIRETKRMQWQWEINAEWVFPRELLGIDIITFEISALIILLEFGS